MNFVQGLIVFFCGMVVGVALLKDTQQQLNVSIQSESNTLFLDCSIL